MFFMLLLCLRFDAAHSCLPMSGSDVTSLCASFKGDPEISAPGVIHCQVFNIIRTCVSEAAQVY